MSEPKMWKWINDTVVEFVRWGPCCQFIYLFWQFWNQTHTRTNLFLKLKLNDAQTDHTSIFFMIHLEPPIRVSIRGKDKPSMYITVQKHP